MAVGQYMLSIFYSLLFVFTKFSIASTLLNNIVVSLYLSHRLCLNISMPTVLHLLPCTYYPHLLPCTYYFVLHFFKRKKPMYLVCEFLESKYCLIYRYNHCTCTWHVGGIQQMFYQFNE